MRPLLVVENLPVPFDRRVWQEACALRDAGAEVVVICPRGKHRDREPLEVRQGIEIHRYPLTAATGGPSGYVAEYGSAFRHITSLVRQLQRRKHFDIVHACNPPDLLFAPALGLKRRGSRFVFDQHDLVPELVVSRFGSDRRALYRLARLAERITYRLADVVIAPNDSYRDVALARGKKDAADVFVVRSAPDLDRFQVATPDPALKRGRPHLLAYLGVMGPQDGVDHALCALQVLADVRDDWQAVFVGDGDVAPRMRELARELRLDERVYFTGRIPDEELRVILSTADVCLAPDPQNPLNEVSTMNKILEYMAMGRAIVSYDLKEARVSAGAAAVYAEPNSPASFAHSIAGLLDDVQERVRMGRVGRERVEGRLSWEHSKRSLLAAYQRALSRPVRSTGVTSR